MTALDRIVDLNEGTKRIRRYAFEVTLRALGAIVRCSRSGNELPGFNEVALQMRRWAGDLEQTVGKINELMRTRVRLMSEAEHRTRRFQLLDAAHARSGASSVLAAAHETEQSALAHLYGQLAQADAKVGDLLEEIDQLALMATVLSRSALIEAAGGTAGQRQDLTIASHEFATYATEVNDAITAAKRTQRRR